MAIDAGTSEVGLMAMLNQMSDSAKAVSAEVQETSDSFTKTLNRQKRRSKELEQRVFGMHLTDVHKLREIFDDLDSDKSGSLDVPGEIIGAKGNTRCAPVPLFPSSYGAHKHLCVPSRNDGCACKNRKGTDKGACGKGRREVRYRPQWHSGV